MIENKSVPPPGKKGFFAHPSALVESATVGDGTRIWAFVHVLEGARIGRDCMICDGAFIEGGAVVGDRVTIKNSVLIWEGVRIESDAFIGPGVVFTNDLLPRSPRGLFVGPRHRSKEWLSPTVVRRNASIGANATVICGITIGRHAMVGAGSVVTKDVPAHALVVGSPARVVGWVSPTGARLRFDESGIARCRDSETLWKQSKSGRISPIKARTGHPTSEASRRNSG